jgi:hypothetical protein
MLLLIARPVLSLLRSLGLESRGDALDDVLTFRLRCFRTLDLRSSLALSFAVDARFETNAPPWSSSNSSDVRFRALRTDEPKELGGELTVGSWDC